MKECCCSSRDKQTKEAWKENWQDVSVEKALEIFTYPRVQEHVAIFSQYLPKGKLILEGGCGVGPYLIYFKQQGFQMVGLDYNEEPLKKIHAYAPYIPLLNADVEHLPFPDAHFGAYLSLGVIEHFSQGPASAIEEAFRVLLPGGYFIVMIPSFSIFNRMRYPLDALKQNSLLRKVFGKKEKKQYWERYFKVKELSGLLERYGFRVKQVVPVDQEHSLMTFCPHLFRDPSLYDGANARGRKWGKFCQKSMSWITAASIIFIARKE